MILIQSNTYNHNNTYNHIIYNTVVEWLHWNYISSGSHGLINPGKCWEERIVGHSMPLDVDQKEEAFPWAGKVAVQPIQIPNPI